MSERETTPATATLEELLARVRLQSAFYFSVSAKAPWATLTPHMDNIGRLVMPDAQTILPFHIMLEGEAWCWRAQAPQDKQRFRQGDILLLPRGCDHVIASTREPGTVPTPDIDVYREAERSRRPCTHVELDGEGPKSNFVCGYFGAPRQIFHPLFDSLADLLILTPAPRQWRTLQQLVMIATQQQADREQAGRLIVSRLAETMFVDAVHQYLIDDSNAPAGWMAALRDSQIARALRAFHKAPMADWSVEALAGEAGLSRSAFAERFQALIDHPPMQYVQKWRIQLAANQLAQTDQPIKQIADACGYTAEPSFHRAFKQQTGVTPGHWRALHRVGPE